MRHNAVWRRHAMAVVCTHFLNYNSATFAERVRCQSIWRWAWRHGRACCAAQQLAPHAAAAAATECCRCRNTTRRNIHAKVSAPASVRFYSSTRNALAHTQTHSVMAFTTLCTRSGLCVGISTVWCVCIHTFTCVCV